MLGSSRARGGGGAARLPWLHSPPCLAHKHLSRCQAQPPCPAPPRPAPQSLLPHLVEKMGSPDPQLVNGVLSTADSIYQRYRCGHTVAAGGWLHGAVGLGAAGAAGVPAPHVCGWHPCRVMSWLP